MCPQDGQLEMGSGSMLGSSRGLGMPTLKADGVDSNPDPPPTPLSAWNSIREMWDKLKGCKDLMSKTPRTHAYHIVSAQK